MASPEEIAARIESGAAAPADVPPKKGPGRPKGSGTKPKAVPAVQAKPVYVPSDETIGACSVVSRLLWDIAGPFIKCRSLTDDEAWRLGAALDPLLHKYLPGMDNWREEVTFLLAVVGIYTVTRVGDDGEGKPDHHNPGPEGVGEIDSLRPVAP